jgi:ribonucleoside-diphosphate reductase alpha subunit
MSQNSFYVIKRNGEKEEVSFDKVTRRIKKLCIGLSPDINPVMIAQKVCGQIYNNVSTIELDELAAQICISMETVHLDYGILASRIIISNNHKCTSPSFSETIYLLQKLISNDVYDIIMKNKDKLNAVINYEKDYLFDYFGFKTLEKAYLMRVNGKVIERIQHLFMRVSVGIHKSDLKSVIQSYELMSNKYFTHATPSLYNAGTHKPQFASCFVGETLVNTLSGPKCIEDVKIGDEVITHLGNVKKVIQTHRNEINGRKLYKVYISKTNIFTATFDHKLYTNNGWKRIEDLTNMDYIMIPKYNGEIKNIDKTFMMFLGIWYSSGQILYNKNITGIAVTIPDTNYKLFNCCESIKEYFEIDNIIINKLSKPNMIQIVYESSKIGNIFNKLYGSDLPKEFYKYETSLISLFLYGLVETNGYLSKITNKNVVDQVYSLCRLHNMDVNKINLSVNDILKEDDDINSLIINNEFKFLRFQKKEEVYNYDGEYVYTLGVEDDHSYSIEGIIAHNCFLMGMEDSVKGIYKAISDMAEISACAGGIGVSLSKIRSKNSYIKGLNGVSNGIIPLCRVLNETARHINQAGKRPGSIAVYIEPHNVEILEFLELRKNTGAESERARDLFLALWISDLFMKRVETNSDWSLFDSNECKNLDNVYGEEFEQLYAYYENNGVARKVVQARKIWNYILTSQIETGTPYISFKDNVNKKSNQSNIGVIKNSNLCNEIVQYSDDKEYAVCTLASISLPNFVIDNIFDFDKLIEVTNTVVRNLNKIIDVNYYPVPETELSNKKHRPMGIGVQGLADVYAKLGFAFDSLEAKELNKQIFETLYYGAMIASHSLAKETEPYSTFKGSPISKGLFQFDLWNIKPSNRYDWETLRNNIMKDGIANSLLIALMPTASTSQILGNNECFEPVTSNMYTRRTIAGDFIIINKYLVRDLMKLNIWDVNMKNSIIAHNGSVQNINNIPQNIKDLYKTVWEIKQKVIIDQAIDRGPFVCQTQSMNLFFEEPTQSMLTSAFFHGWKNGLKTGSYYIRTKPKAQAQQFTVAPCEMCSA